ncbi:MAG: beta-lactamase family protein [bacterium]|nr:beta-lactamase family protein [bacterium]
MNFKSLMSLIALFISLNTSAQISELQYQQIDSLFVDWNKPNHPGGAIGIMQNGKIVFSRAYGLASLEYLVPNTEGTIFNIASASKQFTAMGIVILQQQGKLSVDDDIRKYLPELPEFKESITIRHLLHHTSGLRSFHAVLGLAGWRNSDPRTNADLNRLMKKQKDLNFGPGEEYMYSNTGYMFMVNIIEKVTGEKFTKWMKQTIFEPLGMNNTYVEDNFKRIVPNNATSYHTKQSNKFERAVEYWGYIGSGNMHSTSSDLLKWLKNFYDPQANWSESFEILQTLDKLNNGEENNYAYGLILDETNGHKRIRHGGSIGGFRSFTGVYPDEKLSIVVLSNFSAGASGQKANQISEILLKMKDSKSSLNQGSDKILKTVKLSNDKLKKYEASYWNEKDNYARKIYLKNDTLRYFRSENSENAIIPIGKNEFQMLGVSVDLKVKFEFNGNGKSMIVTIDDDPPILSQEFEPVDLTKDELKLYTGRFYSPELETSYQIVLNDETLSCHHMRHGDFELQILKKDILKGQYPFTLAKYERDKNGIINGIYVSNGRVKNLWFEKQK